MPRILDANEELPWPADGELTRALRQAAASADIVSNVLDEEPTYTKITNAITTSLAKNAPTEVVHYLGFGEVQHGDGKFAIFDAYDGLIRWRSLSDLFASAARAEARLLVVQFLSPRAGRDPAPVPPRAFVPALRGSIGAVIFTTLPVHPREAIAFNRKLYSALGEGMSVEDAVQAARTELKEGERPLEDDSASFGWFGLLTGPQSGLRLFEPGSGGGRSAGDRTGPSSPLAGPEAADVRADGVARPDFRDGVDPSRG
jgi:hypothetical protein